MTDRVLFSLLDRKSLRTFPITPPSNLPSEIVSLHTGAGPSLLIVRDLDVALEMAVGAVNTNNISLVVRGNPKEWFVVELDGDDTIESKPTVGVHTSFGDKCRSISNELGELAATIVDGLTAIDPSLDLFENSTGRWINHGVNFVTLKPQPRKTNIQFTVYGNPDKFSDREFIKQDQNSYSRGWVSDMEDADRFIAIAQESYMLRR